MNKDLFSLSLTLPYSAVNANGRVKADWLLNVFQDAASQQCHEFGISGFDMAKKGLKWVVSQYRIQTHNHLEKSPLKWMAPLVLKTWRAPWKNLYDIRRFVLGPENGPPAVTATGVWILIKAATKKPVRLAPHMPTRLMAVEEEPEEIIRPSGDFGRFDHETDFPVRFLDLDLNQHVNNRVYLRWAIESMPSPHCFDYAPVYCTVVYRREGLFGDIIRIRIRLAFTDNGLITDHLILNRATGDELARVHLEWEKLSPLGLFSRHDS